MLRSQSWLIILAALIGGGVALFFSLRQEDEYTATSSISFENENSGLTIIGNGSAVNQTPPEQTPQARTQTIEDPATVRDVRRSLRADFPISRLQGAIATSLDEESFLVDVTATWGSAGFAAKLANAFAEQASKRINRDARSEFRLSREGVDQQIEALGSSLADQTERAALVNVRTRLDFLSENATPATVVQTAQPADSPISPTPERNTTLGLILGLVAGIVAAFTRDSLDRRLRNSREIQEAVPYPIVGHLRNDAMGKVIRPGPTKDKGVQENLEAVRIIRQNLQFLDVDTKLRVVLVTSALPEEGKSTVAASLACASAAFGKSTLLIECDLRRPALANRLGLDDAPGLTDHLSQTAGAQGVFQAVDLGPSFAGPAINGTAESKGSAARRLDCITAGTMTPQPAELLQSKRFRKFLEGTSANYETVILDTSPLLPVADTLELLPLVDCVLLCVRAGQTTSDQVQAARTAIEHFPKRPTGVVVTGLKKRDSSSYGYYSYGNAYRSIGPVTSFEPAGAAGTREKSNA